MSWWLKNINKEQFERIYKDTPAIEIIHLFENPPKNKEELFKFYLPSRLFRLCSGMYVVVNKEGDKIPFEMNLAQHRVYAEFLKHSRLLILKSRQQGISTFWLLFGLDKSITERNVSVGLMAQGLKEAKKLKERIGIAWDNLEIKFGLSNTVRNSQEFGLSNGSVIYTSTTFRSATLQMLHISEWGKITVENPDKARETITGSMQSIKAGLPLIIESTAEGEKFYSMWNKAVALEKSVEVLSPKDYKPVFLSWLEDDSCRSNIPQPINKEAEEYFKVALYEYNRYAQDVGREEIDEITNEQKRWWVAQLRELEGDRNLMGQEYPAYPQEAFNANKDGSYYANLYLKSIVDKGHLVEGLYEPLLDVNVSVDLGMNDTTCLVFYQVFNKELRIIDEYENWGEPLKHYADVILERYGYGVTVWLPHDARVRELGTGKSRFDIFKTYIRKTRVLPKSKSIANDIELVRKIIPNMYLDKLNTVRIQEMFMKYKKDWNRKLGVFKNKPIHDEYSHIADAVRYMVLAEFHRVNKRKSSKLESNVIDGLAL